MFVARRSTVVSGIAIVAIVCASGCDELRHIFAPSNIEARLVADPSRPGKVGSVVGVGVVQKAMRTARRLKTSPDPACALTVAPGQTFTGKLDIERRHGSTTVAYWRETRTFSVGTDGALALGSDADFRTRIGESGHRTQRWRLVGGNEWLGTGAPDGVLWYHRKPTADAALRLRRAGTGMLQTLLDATDGWQEKGDGHWIAGKAPLRCTAVEPDLAFVDRFVAQVTTDSADLRSSNSKVTLRESWRLTDGSLLAVDFHGSIGPATSKIAAPAPERVVDVAVDRSFAKARETLQDLATHGLAEMAKTGPATHGSTDE